MNKYNARKSEQDGYVFDSKVENEYYNVLLDRIRRGEIRELEVHPKFPFVINGEPLRSHKNRPITYTADFKFWEKQGVNNFVHWQAVVVDVKGMETDVWRVKWALVKALHPPTIFRIIKKVKGEWITS